MKRSAGQQHGRRPRKKADAGPATPQPTNGKQMRQHPLTPKEHPRAYTVSLAISASMISQLEKPELRTFLAGQIARTLTIMQVDEVVVYEDELTGVVPKTSTEGAYESAAKKELNASVFLARILQFCECPPYLRKSLFPIHRDLQFASMINLESPHHTKIDDPLPFREGVTLDSNRTDGTLVDCGLRNSIPVLIKDKIKSGVRVTVKLDNPAQIFHNNTNSVPATVVSPEFPRESQGIYWGYTVRMASSVGKVLSESSYEGGYDLTFGVSDQADFIGDVMEREGRKFGAFKHMMVVFGGSKGLEYSIDSDESVDKEGDDAKDLFTYFVRPLKSQGTRRIRTEENVLIALTAIRSYLE